MREVNQSKRKLLNNLERYINSERFQNDKKQFRKKYGITNGKFKLLKQAKSALIFNAAFGRIDSCCLPVEFDKQSSEVYFAIEKITEDFPIKDKVIYLFFMVYLVYNVKLYELFEESTLGGDLIKIIDFEADFSRYNKYVLSNSCDPKLRNKIKKEYDSYPIIIKLHPDTTGRDLENYIINNRNKIIYYLSLYKKNESKLGKIRTRSTSKKKLYDFIYRHKNLPLKALTKMVNEKFRSNPDDDRLDYEHVNKIRSIEKKRRK